MNASDAGDRGDGVAGRIGPGSSSAPPDPQRVWAEHRRWVAAILLAHKPREADLDDLLQLVAASVVRKIGDLRDPGAIKPWLRTVAINQARLAGREKQRRSRGMSMAREVARRESQDRGPAVSIEADASLSEEARRLMELARSMPEGYREPLLLRCARGMSYKQISAITGLPESTIETRIARGRRMLREMALRDQTKGDGSQESEHAGHSTRGKAGSIPAKRGVR